MLCIAQKLWFEHGVRTQSKFIFKPGALPETSGFLPVYQHLWLKLKQLKMTAKRKDEQLCA